MTDGLVRLNGGKVLIDSGDVALCDDDCCGVDCGPCTAVWEDDTYTGDLIVDFGAGGWTNQKCNQCTAIQGEFDLPWVGACAWQLTDDEWCYYVVELLWPPWTQTVWFQLVITLGFSEIVPSDWRYALTVLIWEPGTPSQAIYLSDQITTGNCLDLFVAGVLTLTKDTEFHTDSYGYTACADALPNEITVTRELK